MPIIRHRPGSLATLQEPFQDNDDGTTGRHNGNDVLDQSVPGGRAGDQVRDQQASYDVSD